MRPIVKARGYNKCALLTPYRNHRTTANTIFEARVKSYTCRTGVNKLVEQLMTHLVNK